ncbi:MAG: class I SAM-dependent methyltransferase [Candidatus Moranbacteria bacterium]|nr:class I SAM-dependent methyltransferase [Candidatus Moranbacteria bacterium]
MRENGKIQKKFYDKYFGEESAWSSADFSDDTKYFTNRFLDAVLRPESRKILEIGCGNGFLTFFLLKRSTNMTAVDVSSKAIENMRGQFSSEIGQGKLRLECGDLIEFLENSNETFDAIVGSGIIHHIEKESWDKLFSLSCEKLKPGGVFSCGPEPNAGGLYGRCWRWAKFFYKLFGMDYDWEVEKGTLNMIPSNLESSLKKAGFHNPEVAPFQVIPHFRSKILAYFDKKIIEYASGRLSLYIIVKGEKL